MKQSKQEIIEKFREMFFGKENYLLSRNFLYMERRRTRLNDMYKSSGKVDKRTMDLVTRNGMNFLKLDRTVLTDEISRQVYDSIDVELDESDEMELFEGILFKYLEGEKIDVHELELFFNNLFNNYIKIFNDPKHYERKTNDRRNQIDKGFVDFKWDDSEIMANMVECAKRIEEFAKYLKTKGIDLDLQMIDFSPSNPIVKAAKDSEIEEVPLQSEISQQNMNEENYLNKIIAELSKYFSTKKQKMTKHNKKNHKKLHPFDETTEVLNYYEELSRDEDATILRILVQDETIDIENITVEQYKLALSNYDKIKDQIDDEYKINIKVALRKCQERTKYSEEQVDEIKMLEFRVGLKPKNR